MASLVYFEKIDEDEQEIRYRFGFDDRNPVRSLTMDKATRRSRPDDGRVDHEFLKASRKVNAVFDDTGRWPGRGLHAS